MPAVSEWVVPRSWRRIEFISDLHLSQSTPRTQAAWEQLLRTTDADAVVMLGDLFEAWVGDDSRCLPFESSCVETLAAASRRCALYFMAGNRDFLVGAEMLAACGVQRLDDPIVLRAFGHDCLLTHGDSLCLADAEYQAFRQRVRSADWQRRVLARPLAERQALARELRVGSMERQLERGGATIDIDPATAIAWLAEAGAATLVHGHTHRPGSNALAPNRWRHVLSDWDFDHSDVSRADLLRLDAKGLTRVQVA
jgi:UDP-2,3-diacylglucosamine hydrolase